MDYGICCIAWLGLVLHGICCITWLGLVLKRDNADGSYRMEMGSVTILPSKFPASAYHQALAVQPVYNELYYKVAHDYQFMKDTLAR